MPIRNFYSLEPDECIVAEELRNEAKCEIFFPTHDKGIDLLAFRNGRHVGIQVKGSRYYYERRRKDRGHSWHTLKREKLKRDKSRVDFYIFLTYIEESGEHKIQRFKSEFLIVPTKELLARVSKKKPSKSGVYWFYFHFEDGSMDDKNRCVFDQRETRRNHRTTNYSQFLNNWKAISMALD